MATAKPKRIWDNYRVIGELRKSERLKFVFAAATRDGFRCVVIREFYLRKKDMTWMPGLNSITVPLMFPFKDEAGRVTITTIMDDFKCRLSEAAAFAETMDLADPEHAIYTTPKEK